ncbi:MAG: hypothetical protein ACQGVK_24900 [Myxococcota bacterium]
MGGVEISKHAAERVRQRGYRERDLDLVMEYGQVVQSGYLLAGRDVARAEAELKRKLARLQRLKGTFVAVKEATVLSVYRPRSVRRIRAGER